MGKSKSDETVEAFGYAFSGQLKQNFIHVFTCNFDDIRDVFDEHVKYYGINCKIKYVKTDVASKLMKKFMKEINGSITEGYDRKLKDLKKQLKKGEIDEEKYKRLVDNYNSKKTAFDEGGQDKVAHSDSIYTTTPAAYETMKKIIPEKEDVSDKAFAKISNYSKTNRYDTYKKPRKTSDKKDSKKKDSKKKKSKDEDEEDESEQEENNDETDDE